MTKFLMIYSAMIVCMLMEQRAMRSKVTSAAQSSYFDGLICAFADNYIDLKEDSPVWQHILLIARFFIFKCLLSAADVFVLPSASEGLANAWVEALACGTPVVTTPIPGAQELLTDPAYGRFAERDADQIAAAVRDLLKNPPARKAVALGAAEFSWEANAAALIGHWRGLAG